MEKFEKQIKDLMSKMTVKEKIGQCIMIEPFFLYSELNGNGEKYKDLLDPKFLDKLLNEYKIGCLFFGGVSSLGNDVTKVWAEYIKQVKEFTKNTRLKIPLFFGSDAIHGVNFIKGSTIYSHNLGVASTWNLELAKKYTETVGNELAAMGLNFNFAPTIDVARDQRWGRVYESLGEDPFLASKFSEALVTGMQNSGKVAACAKHFLGYGESSNGMDRTPADISERSILETHLPPFEAAVKAGVKTVMVNGGDVNGVPMPVSKRLMQNLLRDRLDFKGIVLSDWEDVFRLYERHHVVRSKEEAILRAFNAGLDLNMAVTDLNAIQTMEKLVEQKKITMTRLDEAVERILRVKFELGLFEDYEINTDEAAKLCGDESSKEIARNIASESFVLLKNKYDILPISKETKSILVTGKTANSKRHLCGGWTLGWDSAKEEDLDFETIIEAFRRIHPEINFTYASNIEELASIDLSANNFDLCISIVGETPHAEWLGDSFDMSIEAEELKLLKAAKSTKLPIVMVSVIGRPVNMNWAEENMDAILWAYIPGTDGAGPIVDTLFGENNPSGKLPITFPKDANQIPIVYNARKYTSYEIFTRYEPLYPFGYGLSYTEFEYSNLETKKEITLGEDLIVSVDIQNIGKYSGHEVVQLFLSDQYASVTRPIKSLKGFTKIHLKPNQKETIQFKLTKKDLSLLDEELELVEEEREIEIQIKDLKTKFQIING